MKEVRARLEFVRMSSTRITRVLNAPREKVYWALIDPHAIQKWMVPNGMSSHVHEFDARVGGSFRVSLTYDTPSETGKTTGQTDTYHGHFVELVPNERVVQQMEFETDKPALKGEMTVTYALRDAESATELSAIHDNLPAGVSPEDNEIGWRMSLDKLAKLVEGTSG